VVADQLEVLTLRIDDGLVVYRPIPEVKDETGGDSLATGGLDEIAVSQRSSLECPQDEEAVH
jgi:hypothetical protein